MPDTLLETLITIGIIIMVFNLFILFLGIGYGLVKGKRLDPTTSFKLKNIPSHVVEIQIEGTKVCLDAVQLKT